MEDDVININNMNFSYSVYEKESGFLGSLKDLVGRKYRQLSILEEVNLTIKRGEFIGLLGQNGVGKTTLIKILTGILAPTSGEVAVNGFSPFQKKHDFLQNIGVMLGQKSQLIWDLPASDTYRLLKSIYNLNNEETDKLIKEYSEGLNVSEKINVPVRKLSLGERIKLELIASLITKPKLLFLDEPTIGLDIPSQRSIYRFLKKINSKEKTTIILTSHNIRDIEVLPSRLILLKNKHIIFDGNSSEILSVFKKANNIVIQTTGGKPEIVESLKPNMVGTDSDKVYIIQNHSQIDGVLTNYQNIVSISKEQPELEDVIFKMMEEGISNV